jgi:hypothetical protein
MKRALRISLATLVMSVFTLSPSRAHAGADTIPAAGDWAWCSPTVVNGCVKSVTTISPEKVETTYTDSSVIPSGLSYSIRCSIEPGGTCDGNKYESVSGGACTVKSTWPTTSRGIPDIQIDISWSGKTGWRVKLVLSTGSYQPAFTIGHGTVSAITSDDGDGTFTYTFVAEIEASYSASPPSSLRMGEAGGITRYKEWLSTAEATDSRESVHVQIWPKDHLLNQYRNAAGCFHYPFVGAWAEANAQGFSWSYNTDGATSASPTAPPNKLYFDASAPHYLPRVGTNDLVVMPARVQVFLPAAYFTALGYTTLTEFDSSSYSVTTEDGQKVSPTVVEQDGGLRINLGVQHYSAPNPTIIFKSKNVASTTQATQSSKITTSSKSVRRNTQKSLASLISLSKAGTKTYKVTGGCKISGKNLRTPSRKTTCKLTLTVRNSKKKVLATKTVNVKVV